MNALLFRTERTLYGPENDLASFGISATFVLTLWKTNMPGSMTFLRARMCWAVFISIFSLRRCALAAWNISCLSLIIVGM